MTHKIAAGIAGPCARLRRGCGCYSGQATVNATGDMAVEQGGPL